MSGFPVSTIVVYENGKQKPSHKYLEFCSLYFGYTYECLYDYKTEKALEPFKNYQKITSKALSMVCCFEYKDRYHAKILPSILMINTVFSAIK